MRTQLVGPVILTASGLAWLAASIAKGVSAETAICGAIALGFLVVVVGVWRTRHGIAASGFGIEAVAAALPWMVYGTNGLDFGALWIGLSCAGYLVAAYGTLRGSALLVRAGVAGSLPFAAMNVVQNEVAGHINIWTPGNVLYLVGIVWTALGLRVDPLASRATPTT